MPRPLRNAFLVIGLSMVLFPAPFADMMRQLARGLQALLGKFFDLDAVFTVIGAFF